MIEIRRRPEPGQCSGFVEGAADQVALDLKSGLGLTPGTAITLSADGTKCQILDGAGTISPITVTVGTLTTQ